MMMATILLQWFVLLAAFAGGTSEQSPSTVRVDYEAPPLEWLSGYNLFSNPGLQEPNAGVIPYELSALLFSDYATKHRFVWMPPGASANYHEREVFEFPEGAVLLKSFGYPRDARFPDSGEKLIETRLLVRARSDWKMYPYVWNEDGTDARLALAGARVPVTWVDSGGTPHSFQYIVPNVNQCKHCHIGKGLPAPVGPKARYLNFDYFYPSGRENQLAHWAMAGYLSGLDDPIQAMKSRRWDDPHAGTLEERARTYLDINCAHCHNPTGPAFTSGLDLSFDQATPMRIGIFKAPVAAGRAASIGRYDIVPGKPDESILLYRLATVDPGVRMPTIGRGLVHDEGVALIREWIKSMPVTPAQ